MRARSHTQYSLSAGSNELSLMAGLTALVRFNDHFVSQTEASLNGERRIVFFFSVRSLVLCVFVAKASAASARAGDFVNAQMREAQRNQQRGSASAVAHLRRDSASQPGSRGVVAASRQPPSRNSLNATEQTLLEGWIAGSDTRTRVRATIARMFVQQLFSHTMPCNAVLLLCRYSRLPRRSSSASRNAPAGAGAAGTAVPVRFGGGE